MKVLKVDHSNNYILTINIIEQTDDSIEVIDAFCKDGSITRDTLINMCRDIAHINNCCKIFINDEEISMEEEVVI